MTFDPPGGPGALPAGRPPAGEGEGWWETHHQPPWWEDGLGYDEGDGWAPFPRRRRSRVLKVTGIVVAGALLLASVGTTVEVVLGGRHHPGKRPVPPVKVHIARPEIATR